MRKISVHAIQGNEVLARDIYNSNDKMLLQAGIILKQEYIGHLIQLNITDIFVEDELSEGVVDLEGTESKIQDACMHQVRETLNRFIYNEYSMENEIYKVVEEIILDVLKQKEVLYNISGVRQKSQQLYCHSLNVCTLSVIIAHKLGLPDHQVKEIAIGSMLHDIGFKYVAFDLNDINGNKLTPEEVKEIRKHVIYGYQIVEKERWLSEVSKDIIIGHHELCDKTGYPFRLDSNHIKLENLIVSLCDTFDCLVYGQFRSAMKVHEVIEYITSNSGIKFDKRIVKLFKESIAVYPNGSIVKTNQGEKGIVLRQNKDFPARPVIRLIEDANGNTYRQWTEKDLKTNLTLFIEDTI